MAQAWPKIQRAYYTRHTRQEKKEDQWARRHASRSNFAYVRDRSELISAVRNTWRIATHHHHHQRLTTSSQILVSPCGSLEKRRRGRFGGGAHFPAPCCRHRHARVGARWCAVYTEFPRKSRYRLVKMRDASRDSFSWSTALRFWRYGSPTNGGVSRNRRSCAVSFFVGCGRVFVVGSGDNIDWCTRLIHFYVKDFNKGHYYYVMCIINVIAREAQW